MTTMDVEALIAADPKLHQSWDGQPGRTMKLADDVLRYIDVYVREGSRTLETGCGVSTLLFIAKRAHHVCVSPDYYAIDQIRKFCSEREISLDRVKFEPAPSEVALPGGEFGPLDLVLIDGSHSFPTVFIDWYYTAPRLAIGGRLVIDDLQLWTGRVLRDFLVAEPEWTVDGEFERSVAFVKTSEVDPMKGWWSQQYVVAMSKPPSTWPQKLRRGVALLRNGEFHTVAKKVAATFARR